MRALVKAYLFQMGRVCVCIPTPRGCNLAHREIVHVITTGCLTVEKLYSAFFSHSSWPVIKICPFSSCMRNTDCFHALSA